MGSTISEPSCVSFSPSQMRSSNDEARLPVFGASSYKDPPSPHYSDSSDDEDELPKQKSNKSYPGFRMALMQSWQRIRQSCRYTLWFKLGNNVHHIYFVYVNRILFSSSPSSDRRSQSTRTAMVDHYPRWQTTEITIYWKLHHYLAVCYADVILIFWNELIL